MTLSDYIEELLSSIIYSFSTENAIAATGMNSNSLKAGLRRLTKAGKIKIVRHGFYMIIPPQYTYYGVIPISFYIDALMESIDRSYYVGLYSAAKVYGASHQKVMQEFVITQGPNLRDINKDKIRINFLTVKNWSETSNKRQKSDTGGYQISCPALTAFDLVYFQSKIGGYSIIYTVIEELLESITVNNLAALLQWYDNKSMIQRMGYLLESLDADDMLLDIIAERLKNEKTYQVDLRNDGPKERFSYSKRWKVNVNVKLESDL